MQSARVVRAQLSYLHNEYVSTLGNVFVCGAVVPEEQQGFLKGGQITSSLLALCAVVEASRMQGRRLHVAFVPVAFGEWSAFLRQSLTDSRSD